METLMPDLKSEKAQARKDIRDLFKQLTGDQRQSWSLAITARILDLPEYRQAKTIMVFLSFAKEYDTADLIDMALKAGKRICAPRVNWQTWSMDPVEMTSPHEVVTDAHKINEPAGTTVIPADTIDLVIVPGLAFDVYGHRLGRGGGFYDAFLSRADLCALRLAPTFDVQIRPAIPVGPCDQPVDIIVSPTKTLRFQRAQ
jgi:5-formyltetrahydrofolate cyclo-ligase